MHSDEKVARQSNRASKNEYEQSGGAAARQIFDGGRIQPRLAPETFRTSRLLDIATRRELTAQIGHQPSMWPQVVVKELVDNALDAAEQSETAPQVEVTIIDSMIEVGPNRGAQGNALKTIMVMPFVLDGNAGMVEIGSLGVRHKILFAIDRIAQEPKAKIVREPSLVKNGAIVRLRWPDSACSILSNARRPICNLLYRFAAFNPHLSLISRVGAGLEKNGATEEEIEFLIHHRVELNAFTSDQLVDWIEAKLVENGVEKVVPEEETVTTAARGFVRDLIAKRYLDTFAGDIEREVDLYAASLSSLAPSVARMLEADQVLAWDDALQQIVQAHAAQQL